MAERPRTDKPFQRKGAESNSQVGRDFEAEAKTFFARQGLHLTPNMAVQIGLNARKAHNFDLGSEKERVLVECKAHTWTEGGNVPSAKLTAWNQAMFFFHAAPCGYRKILFVLRDFSKKRNQTLAEYYVRTNPHLIPHGVEIWEFDEQRKRGKQIPPCPAARRLGGRQNIRACATSGGGQAGSRYVRD